MSATRTFVIKPAKREKVPLSIGLFGCSGSGKTFTSLATGIAALNGGNIHLIDTEANRALHYSDRFTFHHVPFDAPFGSLDYLQVIQQCVSAGASVIIIDSASHEHEGPGGYLETHDREVERLSRGDESKRGAVNLLAWAKPSAHRRQFINGLIQINTNLILCFRSKEKVKPEKRNGRTEVVEQGCMPISGDSLLYEMTLNILLAARAGGIAKWNSSFPGELKMMKLPEPFNWLAGREAPLDEEVGRRLADWAGGGKGIDPLADVERNLAAAAEKGTEPLHALWVKLPPEHQAAFKSVLDLTYKPIAKAVDKRVTH
jgi:ABC-type dipeptide/oligopeptide/nickel transport system ATPase subunit